MEEKQTLMTEGPIARQMISFTVPLFIGNLFQQLYNTADALIVGRMLGNDALAAVSATGNLVFLLVSFFVGIFAGAGVAISRFYGARDSEKLSLSIHTNVAFGLWISVLLTVIGTCLTPAILRLMGTPEDIMQLSSDYIRIYFAGSLGLVMYNCLRGIMQAVGNSRDPLNYLIVSSLINIVLDIVFIAVFKTGVGGAAFATVISQFVSVFLCLRKLMITKAEYRLYIRKVSIDKTMLKLIINYGLPSGLQNSVIALANVVVQSNINAFGTMAVSGCGAYSKIEGFGFLPITSFVIAITTFVGQNLGAKEYERAKKGAAFGLICAIITAELVGLAIYIAAPQLIAAFTEEPEAIAFGVQKARTCTLFYFLLAASHSLSAVLRGAGKAVVPMAAMLVFWCVLRVSILEIAVPIFNSIAVVNWVYPITWTCSTVLLMIYYIRADWVHAFEKSPYRDKEKDYADSCCR